MRNKTATVFILLFFAWVTLGMKGPLDYVAPPSFLFNLNGTAQLSDGSPKSRTAVFFDLSSEDTSYIYRSYYSTVTNDSGMFNVKFHVSSEFETAVRIVVVDGIDTLKGPWLFSRNVTREEKTETITTNDCNPHKKIVPVAEIYTFPPQTLILP